MALTLLRCDDSPHPRWKGEAGNRVGCKVTSPKHGDSLRVSDRRSVETYPFLGVGMNQSDTVNEVHDQVLSQNGATGE